MVRLRRVLTVLAVGAVAIMIGATSAIASEAEGCYGSLVSHSVDGEQISLARPPDASATPENPFVVDPQGRVTWYGEASSTITDATWSVSAVGIPFLSGGAPNPEGVRIYEGTLDLATLPAPASWLLTGAMVIPVTGTISGTGGTCTASGYVTGQGQPTSSPFFYAGLVALLLGVAALVGVVATTRELPQADYLPAGYDLDEFGTEKDRHPVLGFLGGLVLGVGVAMLLFVFGVVPVSIGWLAGCAAGFAVLAMIGALVVPARPAAAD